MSVPAGATLDETKAYLRVADDGEDATIARLIAVATELGERFTGQTFMVREMVQAIPACHAWMRLAATPVRSIDSVQGLPVSGAAFALPVGSYAIDIDAGGDGWVRVTPPATAARATVRYQAGLAMSAAELPEALRQGIVRLTAHLFTQRDAADEGAPPAAVATLWRPWRRMRLMGARR